MKNLSAVKTRVATLLIAACLVSLPSTATTAQPARNVILLIGDGMGYQHVDAGSYYLTGHEEGLSFEAYHIGSAMTYSASSSVTDSAAAATALATGVKVNNGVISQTANGTPLETILEIAKEQGKSTGLVTTVPITHATPAGFGAHEASRNSTIAIGNDYLTSSQPNVIFGAGDPSRGGSGYFSSTQVTQAQSIGYLLAYDLAQMDALPGSTGRALGLFNGGQLTYEYDRAPDNAEPHLSQMTRKALELLEGDPDGFFLMIESGLIDWAAHDNNIRRVTRESVEFHYTFQTMLDWLGNRSDTLVILTADHETGGLTAINQGQGSYPTASWTTGGHTGADVPVYALGAESDLFDYFLKNGVINNTDIFRVMNSAIAGAPLDGDPVAAAKGQPDGTLVTLTGKTVTAGTTNFAGTAYVEDMSRAGGIRVVTAQILNPGDRVTLSGNITTTASERVISNPSVTVDQGPYEIPRPLEMPTRMVGGGELNDYTPAVAGGWGTHNTGLLVRVWGRVTGADVGARLFTVDDGSGLPTPLGTSGLLVWCGGLAAGKSITMPDVGAYVAVTGISARLNWGSVLPVVRPREQQDIQVVISP